MVRIWAWTKYKKKTYKIILSLPILDAHAFPMLTWQVWVATWLPWPREPHLGAPTMRDTSAGEPSGPGEPSTRWRKACFCRSSPKRLPGTAHCTLGLLHCPTVDWPCDEIIKGSLGGETSVLRTFRMSGKELVKERVSKERVRQRNS